MAALRDPAVDELSAGSDGPPRARLPLSRLWRGLGAVALLVAGALVVPDLVASPPVPAEPPVTGRESATAAPPEATYPRPAVLDWKIRGDLADDRIFRAAALRHARRNRPDADAVLFAGTLPDGSRLALVALDRAGPQRPADAGVDVEALHVRRGEALVGARLEFVGELPDEDALVAWATRSDDEDVHVVVLGRPAPIEAEVSASISYLPSGHARRSWRPFDDRDGAAVLDLGRSADRIVAVRPRHDRPDAVPFVVPIDRDPDVRRPNALMFRPENVAGLRSRTYAGPQAASVLFAVVEVADPLFDPADADLRVIWSGRVEPGRRGALIRVRLREGPRFQLFVVADDASGGYSASVRRVPWATADVTPWLAVQPEAGKPLLLLNPAGPGTAVIDYDGESRRRVPIDRAGVAELARDQSTAYNIDGSTVTVLSPDGDRVVRSVLSHPAEDDIFVLQ